MKRTIKRSTSVTFLLAATLATACTTLTTDASVDSLLAPLQLALDRPLDELRAAATAGDAASQLAMFVVAAEGLHGEPVDQQAAQIWRGRAIASRGSTPITQYTVAFDGAPSRTNLLYVPRYEITELELSAVQSCIWRLKGGNGRCGSAERERGLAARWQEAKTR